MGGEYRVSEAATQGNLCWMNASLTLGNGPRGKRAGLAVTDAADDADLAKAVSLPHRVVFLQLTLTGRRVRQPFLASTPCSIPSVDTDR